MLPPFFPLSAFAVIFLAADTSFISRLHCHYFRLVYALSSSSFTLLFARAYADFLRRFYYHFASHYARDHYCYPLTCLLWLLA